MNQNKLKIGAFSRLCRVTVRTLRHYEQIGLLVPEIVDRYTGYRYYAISQLQKMQSIMMLKDLGYKLEEIRYLWEDDTHKPSLSSLKEKVQACERELSILSKRKEMLTAMIASQEKLNKMKDIYYESLPAIIVASHRSIIDSYDDLGRLCYEVIGPEMARLGCECPEPGYCYTIERGGYKSKNVDIEYCEKVTRKGVDSSLIQFKEIAPVPMAACLKAYGPYERLNQKYAELFAWIQENGYVITDAPRAVYVDGIWNQEDPEKWLTIIQVPVGKS